MRSRRASSAGRLDGDHRPTWPFEGPTFRYHLGLLVVACAFLASGCVSAPDDTVDLNDGVELQQRSEEGQVLATVGLVRPELVRGSNDFSVDLEASAADSAPTLIRCDAVMPAHGHEASATRIEGAAGHFTALGLDLFMSGRWQVTLGVELEASSDVIAFALDVP